MQNETSNRIPWLLPGYHSQEQPFVTVAFQVLFCGSFLREVPPKASLRTARRSGPATFVDWLLGAISCGMLAKKQTCRAYGKRLTMRLKPADIRKGIGYSSCRPTAGIAQFH